MGTRRKSRELALQVLFQSEFGKEHHPEQSLALYRESFDSTPEVWDFAKSLVHGVYEHKSEVDELIQKYSTHWKLDRMALADRNILRIAAYELKFKQPEVPANVAINEAIEIGRKFGTTDSASFINGILDGIAKHINT